MAMKRMSPHEAVYYVILKQCKILDDDDETELTIDDLQVDHRLNRIRVKYMNGQSQFIGLDEQIDIDVDGVSLETTHTGQETPITPTKPRKGNKKRK
jgi:hypothetical protein